MNRSDNSNRRAAQPAPARDAAISKPGSSGTGLGSSLAAILGTLAAGCSVGLLATSAWLISRSAQRPPVLYLMAPAAVVQAFGLGRAVLRYAERLAGHDAALRLLADRRVRAYDALARLAPAGLGDYRSGDLLARLVSDIDSLADRWLRVRLPYAVAAAVGAGSVALVGVLSPAAGPGPRGDARRLGARGARWSRSRCPAGEERSGCAAARRARRRDDGVASRARRSSPRSARTRGRRWPH